LALGAPSLSVPTVSSLDVSTGIYELTGFPAKMMLCERPAPGHPIYNLVGRVASEWAHLEHLLDLIISELADLPSPRMACVTAQLMGVWPRYNCILALLKHRSSSNTKLEKFIGDLNSISGGSRTISERRNRIIHDPWYVLDAKALATAQQKSMPKDDRKYKWQYGVKEVGDNEIDETLKEIAKLSARVGEFRNALSVELKT
jgi:hypothetical protein